MNASQSEKGARLRALHEAPGVFVIPNAWDGGSARMLAGFGFAALATSSWASAATLGRRDYRLTRDEALTVAGMIVRATDLPVSGDLENGFGDSPQEVAATISAAAAIGLVGGSIEDSTNDSEQPLYPIDVAVERVAAAVAAARSLSFPFTVTARAENFVCGQPDLEDVIRRLQAYERAGADVLFAPGLRELTHVRAVCAAVRRPVNFMNGLKGACFPVSALAAAGVKRISLAASLYRAAMTGLRNAAREISERGTFQFVDETITSAEMAAFLGEE